MNSPTHFNLKLNLFMQILKISGIIDNLIQASIHLNNKSTLKLNTLEKHTFEKFMKVLKTLYLVL